MKILVVVEKSTGEYELRGEKFSSILFIDLSKLNEISKGIILKGKLQQKWADDCDCSLGDITPMDDVDWSFDDILESNILSGENYKVIHEKESSIHEFNRTTSEFDISDEVDLHKFKIKVDECLSVRGSTVAIDSVFMETYLSPTFSNAEIDSFNITSSISVENEVISNIIVGVKSYLVQTENNVQFT